MTGAASGPPWAVGMPDGPAGGAKLPASRMRLLRIVAPHFVAGVLVDPTGHVAEAAPILRYSLGWTGRKLRAYAAGHGWSAAYL